MNQSNPYESPQSQAPDLHLAKKARRLLERRDEPVTLIGFLSGQWRRHLLVAMAFFLLCAAAWSIGNLYLLIGLGSFWAGRIVRDLQWYRTLVLEWDSTKELLDWEKIERLSA